MKILHVIPSFAPAWRYGGPIYAAMGLTRELARQGHEVAVMTTNIDGPGVLDVPVKRPVSMEGVEVWYFPVEHPRWWCFSGSLGKALQLQVKRFDLVHIHSIFLWPTTAAAFWSQRSEIPYIVRPAGALDPVCLTRSYDNWWVSLMSRGKKGAYLKTIGRMDLHNASALHFTSLAEMEAARSLRLRPPGFVVPLGVELAPAEGESASLRLRERYPQLGGKRVVLFFSRLDPKKGLDLLVAALGDLASRHKDFSFVLAGGGTSGYTADVVALVERHGLQERTVFLGPVEGSAKWLLLQEADLFVLPSYQENFGVAVVEAMAAGLPVVISNRVNIHREVSQAGAGLVTDLDPKQIAAAVEQLITDGDLRRDMGRKGTLLVRREFTWEKIAKHMLQVYGHVIKGNASGLFISDPIEEK